MYTNVQKYIQIKEENQAKKKVREEFIQTHFFCIHMDVDVDMTSEIFFKQR